MEPPALDLVEVTRVVIWIHVVSVVVATLEYLRVSADFGERGAFAWSVFRTARGGYRLPPALRRIQAALFRRTGSVVLLAVQVAAVLAAALLPMRTMGQWLALLVSSTCLGLLAFRQRYGEDGADQMNLIVSVALVLTVGPFQSDTALRIGLAFIAAQLVLSYASAGIAKVVSPVWRSGRAVGLVVDTATYGSRQAGAVLRRWPRLGYLLTWAVIVFEVSFVAMVFLPWPWVMVPLAVGATFHASIALVMGLNNFLPAFLSTYPAMLYSSLLVTSQL